jgi:glutamate N-acetyltransferase/amino-acid N-acetyltransferase
VASGVRAGIRRSAPDLALVRSLEPAVGGALWTTNRVQAAPVEVSRRHLALAEPQAVVVNAGVANAATGERGELDALAGSHPLVRAPAADLDRRDRGGDLLDRAGQCAQAGRDLLVG